MNKPVKSTCPYCGVGCGVIVSQDEAGGYSVKGDAEHPANRGLLCSKGSALADTLTLDGRLLQPEVAGKTVDWDEAISRTATGLQTIIAEHGPDAVAFYVSGQLLTEDYYVANKLMKGFIGSGNIDTNSRLCMSSAVAGYKRAFGSDTVPGCYEDIERAKLIVLVGSNTAWCHPVIYQRIMRAKKANPDLFVVVIDPRKTATSESADLHLALAPGSDQLLFNGLFKYIVDSGEADKEFVRQHTQGFEQVAHSALPEIKAVIDSCQLNAQDVEKFYRLFARTDRVVTMFSQGINQWSNGTDRVNAIINVHLLTGRIGRPGMGPFSITGQPNAMGGREVGGMANQLAAHMSIENQQHHEWLKQFWQAPALTKTAGLKAVELFQAIEAGTVKAVWIMATNPAVSLPDSSKVRAALKKCELVIVSDCMRANDTTQYADILLPAQTWGERDGTVTNSERCISRQRPFLNSAGEARADWWIITQVAKKLGYEKAFGYQSSAEIFREHARLSGWHNQGTRDFDISAFADLDAEEYEQLQSVQWPVTQHRPGGTQRMFGNGQYYTDDGKARFVPVGNNAARACVSAAHPFMLNTGRVRDHWHSMTRTGKSARLSMHMREPYLELHPDDALEYRLKENALARVSSVHSQALLRVRISAAQQKGQLFIPIHWNDQFAAQACVNQLVPVRVDPVSGQPEFKNTPVTIEASTPAWYGFVITRRELPAAADFDYWAKIKNEHSLCYELAGFTPSDDWTKMARSLLCADEAQAEWIEFYDSAQSRYRAARIDNGVLDSCIFIGPDCKLPDKHGLLQMFSETTLEEADRRSILSGESASPMAEQGAVVCACFSVGINSIRQAIEQRQLHSVDEIGAALRAGTNCGSCRPEIQALLDATLNVQA